MWLCVRVREPHTIAPVDIATAGVVVNLVIRDGHPTILLLLFGRAREVGQGRENGTVGGNGRGRVLVPICTICSGVVRCHSAIRTQRVKAVVVVRGRWVRV